MWLYDKCAQYAPSQNIETKRILLVIILCMVSHSLLSKVRVFNGSTIIGCATFSRSDASMFNADEDRTCDKNLNNKHFFRRKTSTAALATIATTSTTARPGSNVELLAGMAHVDDDEEFSASDEWQCWLKGHVEQQQLSEAVLSTILRPIKRLTTDTRNYIALPTCPYNKPPPHRRSCTPTVRPHSTRCCAGR